MPRIYTRPKNFIDLSGRRFGRWKVIGESGQIKNRTLYWNCICDCGNEVSVNGTSLREGLSSSCGCLRREVNAEAGRRSRTHTIEHNIFDLIDTEEKAYWLGFILADGNISKRLIHLNINLGMNDKGHLEKFLLFMGSSAPLGVTTSGCCRLSLTSKQLVSRLVAIGINPRKSLSTRSIHAKIPVELHRHYWRGLVDGDGWLIYSDAIYPSIGLCGDIDVIENFKKYAHQVCVADRKIEVSGNIFVIRYSGGDAVSLAKSLYSEATIYLERKYNRYLQFLDYDPFFSRQEINARSARENRRASSPTV
jgi:hypothetical protein